MFLPWRISQHKQKAMLWKRLESLSQRKVVEAASILLLAKARDGLKHPEMIREL